MSSSLPPRALSFLMMSPGSFCKAAWQVWQIRRCIDLYSSLYQVVAIFLPFLLSSAHVDSLDTPLITWQRQDSDCNVCFHLERWNAWKLLEEFSRRERDRLVEKISPAKASTAINHGDSWPGSLSTSPVEERMAAGAWHWSSSHTWLLCRRLFCLFGHPPLPCLHPAPCFILGEVGKLHAHAALTQQISF